MSNIAVLGGTTPAVVFFVAYLKRKLPEIVVHFGEVIEDFEDALRVLPRGCEIILLLAGEELAKDNVDQCMEGRKFYDFEFGVQMLQAVAAGGHTIRHICTQFNSSWYSAGKTAKLRVDDGAIGFLDGFAVTEDVFRPGLFGAASTVVSLGKTLPDFYDCLLLQAGVMEDAGCATDPGHDLELIFRMNDGYREDVVARVALHSELGDAVTRLADGDTALAIDRRALLIELLGIPLRANIQFAARMKRIAAGVYELPLDAPTWDGVTMPTMRAFRAWLQLHRPDCLVLLTHGINPHTAARVGWVKAITADLTLRVDEIIASKCETASPAAALVLRTSVFLKTDDLEPAAAALIEHFGA